MARYSQRDCQRIFRLAVLSLGAGWRFVARHDLLRPIMATAGTRPLAAAPGGLVGTTIGLEAALLPEHVDQFQLPRSRFDKDDSRASSFIRRHGGLWQTELDALDPDDLRALFETAFENVWDMSVYQEQLDPEPQLLQVETGNVHNNHC